MVQGNSFIDNEGREWILNITFGTLNRANKELKIDLDKMIGHPDEMTNLIFNQPMKFGALLWIIVEKQAKAKAVNEDSFIDALGGGESHQDMISAFLNALVSFCPRTKVAQAIREKWSQLQEKMDAHLIEMVNQASHEAISKMDTKLRELSGSIQTNTATGN